MSSDSFPSLFAVIRTQGYERPCLQFLRSIEENLDEFGDTCYRIENVPWAPEMDLEDCIEQSSFEFSRAIFTLPCLLTGNPFEEDHVELFQYWHLPFYFLRGNHQIPILEFHFKTWLPGRYYQVSLNGRQIHNILDTLHQINRERLEEIHTTEDNRFRTPPRTTSSFRSPPPLRRRMRANMSASFHSDGIGHLLDSVQDLMNDETMESLEMRLDRLDGHPRSLTPPRAQTPPRPSSTTAHPSLPKHVGNILLAHARTTTDECPIAAKPYRDCTQISVTNCFHIFDTPSLERWRQESSSCPVCRTQILAVVTQ